jgi:pre-mRNA-splicing factor ISY1
MASACKSLRDCERWRGEILREISRKVSKIQDAGLTDYEVRDLNDEINKLMREKRHWENQIVALGGANYRRNVAMLDDDGKEVPGTKGYKYFGRAKDLPGVRELFQSRKTEEEEENQALAYYKKFMNQGPPYYGDLDELDGKLLQFEKESEEEAWEEAYSNLREALDLPADQPIPKTHHSQPTTATPSLPPPPAAHSKRKAEPDGDADMSSPEPTDAAKRSKPAPNAGANTDKSDVAVQHAQAAAAYIAFLQPDELLPPKMPTRPEMEGILLGLRKKALVEEYFGEGGQGV